MLGCVSDSGTPLLFTASCAEFRLEWGPLLPELAAARPAQPWTDRKFRHSRAPFMNSRRLFTDADVKEDDKRAQGSVALKPIAAANLSAEVRVRDHLVERELVRASLVSLQHHSSGGEGLIPPFPSC